jgi:hypothetical protein
VHNVSQVAYAVERLVAPLAGGQVGHHVGTTQVDGHHPVAVGAEELRGGGPDSRGGSGDDVRALWLAHGGPRYRGRIGPSDEA